MKINKFWKWVGMCMYVWIYIRYGSRSTFSCLIYNKSSYTHTHTHTVNQTSSFAIVFFLPFILSTILSLKTQASSWFCWMNCYADLIIKYIVCRFCFHTEAGIFCHGCFPSFFLFSLLYTYLTLLHRHFYPL